MNVPWDEIKAEYVAGNISQRDLAEAHGVPRTTLEERARREHWTQLRKEARGKTDAKLTDAISDAKLKKVEKIIDQLLTQCQIASRQLSKRQRRITETEKTPEGTVIFTVRTEYEDGRVVDVGNLKALTETVYKLDDMMRKARTEAKGENNDDNTVTVRFLAANGNDYSV